MKEIKNKDLLVVLNIFGEKTNDDVQIQEYLATLSSIFWHIDKHGLQERVRVVVSACLVSDKLIEVFKKKLKDKADIVRYSTPILPPPNAPAWGKAGRWPCQVTFNKTCLVCEDHFNEEYNGYFFIGSGLMLPRIDDLFPRIIEKNNSGDYGLIQLQVNSDQGYHWLGYGPRWHGKIDFSKDYDIPIGNNCNWHLGVFNRSLKEYYGVPESDIHGVCGLESSLSYTSYALRKKYILLGNSVCSHAPQGDHTGFMKPWIKALPMIDCGRLWGRTNDHFLNDVEGYDAGLGYFPGPQCNNEVDFFGVVMPHRQEKYDANYMSNDPRCKEAVKRQYFTNKNELNYDEIEYTVLEASTRKQSEGFLWPLINDNITTEDRRVMSNFILKTPRFTNGIEVKNFEQKWSKWLGTKYSVMVGSGAAANYITTAIVRELKGQKGEIIVPPIGWVSDISAVINTGFTPVFVDVDLETMAITYENIKNAITEDTKAIVLVHALGFNGINDKLIELAKQHDLIIIEDCCESHGATYKGKKIGTLSDMSCFSFYFGHHMTTIEGGMISTDSEEIYQLARMFRSHGMTREASKEIQEKYASPDLNPLFTFAVPGYNMRSTELNAVLGLEQLRRLDSNIEARTKNLHTWIDNLSVEKYYVGYNLEGSSNYALPLILSKEYADSNFLKKVCQVLEEERVEYRLGTAGGGNQARQPYLQNYEFKVVGDLDISNYIHDYGLYIGNHPGLTDEQIVKLCRRLNDVQK